MTAGFAKNQLQIMWYTMWLHRHHTPWLQEPNRLVPTTLFVLMFCVCACVCGPAARGNAKFPLPLCWNVTGKADRGVCLQEITVERENLFNTTQLKNLNCINDALMLFLSHTRAAQIVFKLYTDKILMPNTYMCIQKAISRMDWAVWEVSNLCARNMVW